MISILIYVITTIFVVCSLLLTLVVMMQRPRSEGLGAAFGGGMTESLFGAQTTDVLTKITIWLAVVFFLCTMSLALLYSKRTSNNDLERQLKAKAAVEQALDANKPQPAANATLTTPVEKPADTTAPTGKPAPAQ